MATVKIHGQRVPPELKAIEIAPDGDDVESILLKLVNEHKGIGEFLMAGGNVRTDISILINGRHCMFIDGLKTRIAKGDLIDILMPVIGG